MKYRVLRPWLKRFRGSKRYYARLERKAANFSFPLDRPGAIDLHEHFDFDGQGLRGFKERRRHLRAMFVAFRRVLEQAARTNRPLHVFAIAGPAWDSPGDAVYVLSPDVCRDPFEGLKWNEPVPLFLREHVDDEPSWEVGVKEQSGNRWYYVRKRVSAPGDGVT